MLGTRMPAAFICKYNLDSDGYLRTVFHGIKIQLRTNSLTIGIVVNYNSYFSMKFYNIFIVDNKCVFNIN